jgi:hypothetical protein
MNFSSDLKELGSIQRADPGGNILNMMAELTHLNHIFQYYKYQLNPGVAA